MADWWRSWHGAPTDPKWLAIARRANTTPPMVTAVAWALLDYASQHDERGCVEGFDSETYAVWAGVECALVDNIVAAMTDKQMIVDGRLAAWQKRQPQREDSSTERVRAHRARVAAASSNEETHRNADETQGNAPEVEEETERERETDTEPETEGTGEGERARAPATATTDPDEITALVDTTAEILTQCAWVGDSSPVVRKQVRRTFELVPEFNTRDGPFQAERYGLYPKHHKHPPADWYRSWLNWIKQAVKFEQHEKATQHDNGKANQLDRTRAAIAAFTDAEF